MAFLSAGQRGITFYAGTTGMIFDSTLNWPLRWFHQMLDNEDDASHYPYSFSSETCNVHGKGPEACDAMCGSAKAMFGSIEATRKCLQLAFLWQASMTFTNEAGRELIREVETRMSPNQTLDLLKFDGMTVFRQTYECAEASCRNDGSACNYNFDSVLSFLEGNVSTGAPIMDGSFCEGVHPIPNVDIAGPGIYLTLLSQSIICLFVWIISVCFVARKVIDTAAFPVHLIYHKLDFHGTPKRWTYTRPRLSAFFKSVEESNFFLATTSFMVELGEAQCFYVITLAIAVIYSDSQGAIFNGAENFPSIIKNQSVTLFVVYMASLPMITVQLSLRYVSMDSVYTLFFTTLATALAGVAVTLKEKDISTDQARRMFMQDRALEECGGNPSLRALCDRTDATSLRISRPSSDIWTALGVLACLWCLKLLQGRFSKIERLCSGALTTNGKSERSASAKALLFIRVLVWLCPQLCSAVLLAAHLFFVCLTFVNLARISGEMKSSYDDGYLPWNLGQVVAMLVWVPMLAKYTYAILFGVESGLKIRLSETFAIMRWPEKRHTSPTLTMIEVQEVNSSVPV